MLRLILICGFKRSGKDTMAQYLEHKYDFKHLKISTPLKDATKILFNFSDSQLENEKKDEVDPRWNMTPREVMIYLGTNVFQYKINDILPQAKRRFWINNLINELERKYLTNDRAPTTTNIVVSDLRFKHEYEAICEFQMKFSSTVRVEIVKIVRTGGLERRYHVDSHESETDHLSFEYHQILNNVQDEQAKFFIDIDAYMTKTAANYAVLLE